MGRHVPPHDAGNWLEQAAQLRRQGRLAEAVDVLKRALEHAPGDAQMLAELAHVLRWQGRLEEARSAATRATEIAPELANAWFNLGAAEVELGGTERGIEAYRKALALTPEFAEAWSNLGDALGTAGDRRGEIEAYRRAIGVNPQLAPIWSNLGNALLEAGETGEAVSACRRAIELDANLAAAWSHLGNALREGGEYGEAVRACERALEISPQLAEAWSNLGSALMEQGEIDKALAAHRRALEMLPQSARAHYNQGLALERCHQYGAAIASYRRAVEIVPDFPVARMRLACTLLTRGDFAEGWPAYEWRWREVGAPPKRYDFTTWAGERRAGRRLLLWGEQGLGDEILYTSMIGEVADGVQRVILEIDPRLVPLMQRSFPGVSVVARTDPASVDPATFDHQSSLGSLGRWLRPSFDAFPAHGGYIRADAGRVALFAERLRLPVPGKVVGISWSSANRDIGTIKTSTLADWAGLLRVPGTRFVDLQYGDTAEAREALRQRHGVGITHLDDLDLFNDIEGLAALCSACDLVITVSNVTAHLAGALGKPVWLLAPSAKGRIWYWFSGRSDSPWYPSMRVFTQTSPGSWREVLTRVEKELAAFAGNRS